MLYFWSLQRSKSSSKVSLNADNMYLLFEIKLMFTFKSVYYSMDVSTLSLIQWWLFEVYFTLHFYTEIKDFIEMHYFTWSVWV